jgi:hypothetical protein
MSDTNHVEICYDILRSVMSLPPDKRDNVFGLFNRVVELYLQSPPNEPNESNAEYELRMRKLDETLDDALDAMERSMQRSSMQPKQAGSSRKRVRKKFKKSKTKYTTRRHK